MLTGIPLGMPRWLSLIAPNQSSWKIGLSAHLGPSSAASICQARRYKTIPIPFESADVYTQHTARGPDIRLIELPNRSTLQTHSQSLVAVCDSNIRTMWSQ